MKCERDISWEKERGRTPEQHGREILTESARQCYSTCGQKAGRKLTVPSVVWCKDPEPVANVVMGIEGQEPAWSEPDLVSVVTFCGSRRQIGVRQSSKGWEGAKTDDPGVVAHTS